MSDMLWWLAQPSGLALAALAVMWLLMLLGARRLALVVATVTLLAAVAVVALPLPERLAARLEAPHPPVDRLPGRVDGIVVLGGSVDWRVSAARRQANLGAAGERMLAGAALARRYPEARLVFTGVGREALAQDLAATPGPRALLDAGLSGRDPMFLAASSSTYEDALLALERVAPGPDETWLLVTSAWHMTRAWATFRTLGWTTVPYPVDHLTTGEPEPGGRLQPVSERLALLDRVVREWGALWIYRRSGRIAEEALP